ncbi:uncharacterized protein H6S33_007924 [Morchella sextelata]|uniref:uncharacterized protein n=1 Tax=Morchella sextelata TaxID=1174677 RepID=UPI001D049197|nr:uncharacterized protein H6S33_007924 [Morchella sextelata]KAH0602920.1 hypothetical protein H6S33_007924 [Morchella sextelata]
MTGLGQIITPNTEDPATRILNNQPSGERVKVKPSIRGLGSIHRMLDCIVLVYCFQRTIKHPGLLWFLPSFDLFHLFRDVNWQITS